SVQAIAILVVAWLVVRFCGLDVSPPGFWMDESWPASHAMCLAETGKNADGVPWPLYSNACGGGHHPLTLLAFDVAWLKFFGTSRAAFRAVAAFWIEVTCLGIFVLARDLAAIVPDTHERAAQAKRVFPWLALTAAVISPWGFQFSRVAWEGPLAPAFMVLALMSLLRMRRSSLHSYRWAIACGLFCALSMSTYPPLRATVPLVMAWVGSLLWLAGNSGLFRRQFTKRLTVAAISTFVCLTPTLVMLWKGDINGRMNDVLVSNPTWVRDHRGIYDRNTFIIKTFLDNITAHLQPSYLFIHGDTNPRHSSQLIGELSPLDMLALAISAITLGVIAIRILRQRSDSVRLEPWNISAHSRWFIGIALAAVVCGFFGVLPSALTYESIPHALRSIGAWPFVALFTAAVLALAWRVCAWVPPVVALVTAGYSCYFLPAYFHTFDRVNGGTYFPEITEAIRRGRLAHPPKSVAAVVSEDLGMIDEVLRYYLMHDGKMTCEQSAATLRELRARSSQ
ncbi:MAG TPA: hypothetical protein VIV60_15905, partial [Polyangiaceae bacterium]